VNADGTRLVLIRHAHVDTGPDGGRLCGWLDLPLSARGELQLSSFLCDAPVSIPNALYTSSLARAVATAEALAQRWNLRALPDPSLREIFCGTFEGLPIRDIQRNYPEMWARNSSQGENDFAWPEGESYQHFRARVLAALSCIAARHPHQRVVVVTHAGAITQVIGALEGRPPAEWDHHRSRPFSATELVWNAEGPLRLLSFNRDDWWRESPLPGE
jgi:broad specificity phosphatase PhoE